MSCRLRAVVACVVVLISSSAVGGQVQDDRVALVVEPGRPLRVRLNERVTIEHVGYSDQQVLDDPRQMSASLRLVRWLRCRFHISIRDVIGHNESLSSPYHHEDVPSLRTQTHGDFVHADMQVYRHRLRALGGCPAA